MSPAAIDSRKGTETTISVNGLFGLFCLEPRNCIDCLHFLRPTCALDCIRRTPHQLGFVC